MFIKNTVRLMANNLNLAFKAVLFRLIVTVVFLFAIYGICYAGIASVLRSDELVNFIESVRGLWLQFLNISSDVSVEIETSSKALYAIIVANSTKMTVCLVCVFVCVFAMNFVLGLCNFTMGVMVDRYMSSLSKTHFIQTFLESLKKATPFELFFALLKTLVYILVVAIFLSFVVLTWRILSIISILIGLWGVIAILALFYTFTVRMRPSAINGDSFKKILSNKISGHKVFSNIFASYIFNIVLIASVNVVMLFSTLGAGIMVSIPVTFLYLLCFQQIVDYTIMQKRYYIDYDNIIVPVKLRSEDEKLLNDVEI